MTTKTIIIDAEKFKEILIYSWHLLPAEKQKELLEIGICPINIVS